MIVCLAESTIQAAIYHVSPFGSNTPPYDTYAKAAHQVVDAAAVAVSPSDTILVHAGSYSSSDTIYMAEGVTLLGAGKDSTSIIWGDDESSIYDRMVSLAGGNLVNGLEFRYPLGVNIDYDDVTALHAFTAQPIIVENCRFAGVGAYLDGNTTFEVAGNEFQFGKHLALFVGGRTCKVFDNHFQVSNADGSGNGVWAWLADTVVIEGNQFLAEEDADDNPFAIEVKECGVGRVRNNLIRNCYASIIWDRTDGVIENNTMIHSDPDWFASFEVFQGTNDHVTIRNNVFMDMARPIAWGPNGGADTAGLTTFVHNVFWPPRDTLYKMYSGTVSPARFPVVESLNVFSLPMFENESTYCPQVGSPLIDAGDPLLSDVDLTRSDIGWHGGEGGYLCQFLDLPPQRPASLALNGEGGVVALAWSSRPEADLKEYHLYRGSVPGFWLPGLPVHRVIVAPDTTVTDTLLSAGDSYYYVVTARDAAGLESAPSVERGYTITGILDDPSRGEIPRAAYISRVYPNPFNATTTIEVYIPDIGAMPAPVRVVIYDVTGRRVADAFEVRLGPGQQSIEIKAVDQHGQALASGVYFARLQVWNSEFGGTKKLVLIK